MNTYTNNKICLCTFFQFLCTPIDKTTQKNFYKIKFSCQYRYSDMIFLIFLFFASASFVMSCGEFWVRLRLL